MFQNRAIILNKSFKKGESPLNAVYIHIKIRGRKYVSIF